MFPNRLCTPNRGHSRIPKAAALPEPGGSPGQRRYRRDGGGRLHLEHFLSSSPLFPSLCAQNFCSVWVRAGRSGRGSPAAGAPLREPLVPSQPAGLGKGPGSAPLLVPISPAPSSAPRGAWNPAASRPHGSASLSPRASLCPAGVTLPALGAPYPHAPPPAHLRVTAVTLRDRSPNCSAGAGARRNGTGGPVGTHRWWPWGHSGPCHSVTDWRKPGLGRH